MAPLADDTVGRRPAPCRPPPSRRTHACRRRRRTTVHATSRGASMASAGQSSGVVGQPHRPRQNLFQIQPPRLAVHDRWCWRSEAGGCRKNFRCRKSPCRPCPQDQFRRRPSSQVPPQHAAVSRNPWAWNPRAAPRRHPPPAPRFRSWCREPPVYAHETTQTLSAKPMPRQVSSWAKVRRFRKSAAASPHFPAEESRSPRHFRAAGGHQSTAAAFESRMGEEAPGAVSLHGRQPTAFQRRISSFSGVIGAHSSRER